jgi:diguanylate cyclase (GGDEF)-like protein
VVVITFIIAILNICLGFALAMYLGYGPAGLNQIWNALGSSHRQIMPSLSSLSLSSPGFSAGSMEEPPETSKEDKLAGGTTLENTDESHDDSAAGLLESSLPENWDLDERYVETSILRLNIAIIKSDQRTVEIDSQLRACQGHCDKDVVETCLRLLREDCIAYLSEQKEAAEKFQSRIHEFGEMRTLCEDIETANLEQAAQVETTLSNLEYMDFHSDPEAASQRLLEEIKNLYVARHKLRDNHEVAFLILAKRENRLDKIEKRLFRDPLTRLYNRIGLETTLDNWWRQGRHHTRQIIAMLFDIDGFGVTNYKFGLVAGDRILYQIAQYFQTSIGKSDIVGRYSGQQFLIMALDVDTHTALKFAETQRQSIEKILFLHENKPIHITVSGAVTIVALDETYPAVFERLENIIGQVKHTGPNRLFFHNGTNTAPVESHNLGLQETTIVI